MIFYKNVGFMYFNIFCNEILKWKCLIHMILVRTIPIRLIYWQIIYILKHLILNIFKVYPICSNSVFFQFVQDVCIRSEMLQPGTRVHPNRPKENRRCTSLHYSAPPEQRKLWGKRFLKFYSKAVSFSVILHHKKRFI